MLTTRLHLQQQQLLLLLPRRDAARCRWRACGDAAALAYPWWPRRQRPRLVVVTVERARAPALGLLSTQSRGSGDCGCR
jgi:hypothetical protein